MWEEFSSKRRGGWRPRRTRHGVIARWGLVPVVGRQFIVGTVVRLPILACRPAASSAPRIHVQGLHPSSISRRDHTALTVHEGHRQARVKERRRQGNGPRVSVPRVPEMPIAERRRGRIEASARARPPPALTTRTNARPSPDHENAYHAHSNDGQDPHQHGLRQRSPVRRSRG